MKFALFAFDIRPTDTCYGTNNRWVQQTGLRFECLFAIAFVNPMATCSPMPLAHLSMHNALSCLHSNSNRHSCNAWARTMRAVPVCDCKRWNVIRRAVSSSPGIPIDEVPVKLKRATLNLDLQIVNVISESFTYRIIVEMQRFDAHADFIGYIVDVRGIDEIGVFVGVSYEHNIARRSPYFADNAHRMRNAKTGRCHRTQHKACTIF